MQQKKRSLFSIINNWFLPLEEVSLNLPHGILVLGGYVIFFFGWRLLVDLAAAPLNVPPTMKQIAIWVAIISVPFYKRAVYLTYLTFTLTYQVLNFWSQWNSPRDLSNALGNAITQGILLMVFAELIHLMFLRIRKLNQKLKKARDDEHSARLMAEKAVEAKSLFLANMSHEIRTPISGILGMSDILREYIKDDSAENYLDMIRESSESLLYIINDILDYSKIESGSVSLNFKPFNLSELLDQVTEMHRNRIEEKGLSFSTSDLSELPKFILGDKTRLMQVLNNLMSNAVKYTLEGGIRFSVYQERQGERGVNLRFEIQDTGIGIPEEDIQNLFQAFNQLDSSYSKRFEGTGLGLAITKNLVQLMDGEIGVESVNGEGSTFYFSVNLDYYDEMPENSDYSTAVSNKNNHNAISILIAEDNRINQVFLRHLLEKGRHKITLVEDGIEVVKKYKENEYDLVILDMQLPLMSGIDALMEIRDWEQKTRRRPVPICALTAYAMDQDRKKVMEAGGDYFLSKPFNVQKLMDIIRQISVN